MLVDLIVVGTLDHKTGRRNKPVPYRKFRLRILSGGPEGEHNQQQGCGVFHEHERKDKMNFYPKYD